MTETSTEEATRERSGTIRTQGLLYRYQRQAREESPFELRLPDLSIAAGERSVCVGPSGSGKSTFLRLLAGILVPVQGQIVVDGLDWASLSTRERRQGRLERIGLVFQDFALLEHLSVLENILLPYLLSKALPMTREAKQRAKELADSTGIYAHHRKRPSSLSQGERQRVAICRALVTAPRVILADEPTGNLDPASTRRILDLLIAEVDRRGTGLVMVTHDHGLLGDFDRSIDFQNF